MKPISKLLIFVFIILSLTSYAQISGTVFIDYNSNGIKEAIEPGIKNVQVAAYDDFGNIVGTAQNTSTTGTYSLSVSTGSRVRIMFTTLPTGFYEGRKGTGSSTNVQFITAPNSNVNLGILNPEYYCQDLPKVTMSMMTNGNPLGGGTSGTAASLFSVPFDASGRNNNGGTNATTMATNNLTGATWGQAYQKETNTLFLSSLYRRYAGFGPLGISGIYKVVNANSSPVASNFIAINSLSGTFDFGTDAHSGLPAASSTPSNDAAVFSAVGKNGIGDMDISEDGKWLYLVNLKDKNLYGVFINNPYRTPINADIDKYVIPNPGCSNSEYVPFAVKCYGAYVYVGIVCTAETSKNLADLKASVYRLDPITGTWTAMITGTTFPLNFGRGSDYGSSVNWQAWSSTASVIHQPILAGIEFNETNNDMILSFMDRAALQWGYQNYPPTGNTLTNGLATGDIIKLCQPSGSSTWSIESNGSACSVAGSGVGNAQGPSGGEFFNDWATAASNAHDQPMFGGLIKKPGGTEIFGTGLDPQGISNSGGIIKYSLSNGAKSTGYELYTSTTVANFGNASSMGDMEILCDANPIEIGNLVWNDANENGRQDPNENGIDGVTVQLYDDVGVLKGTTVTSGGGQYFFNNGNVSSGINLDVNYEIRVPITGALLYLTSTNPNAYSDEFDSDATTTLEKTYAFIFTGGTTNTSHNYDFGFKCGTNEVLPQDFDVCAGSTFQLCADDLGSSASYNWSTGQTTRCITVTVNNPVSYSITVTASNGCQGSDIINLNTQPNIFVDAGGDLTICQGITTTLMSQAYTGLAPFTYSWNNGLGTGANKNVTPSVTTTYTVTVTDATGCIGTDDVIIFVRPSPTANAGPDQSTCAGACVTLTGSSTGGTAPITYTWSNGLGAGQSKQACPTVSTTYTLTVSDFFGCSKTDQAIVTAGSNLAVNAGADVNICNGSSTTLIATGTGGTSPYTYNWSNNLGTGSSKTVNPTATTTYTVTITDSKSCTSTDQIIVNVNPVLTANAGIDQTLCNGGTTTLTAIVSGGMSPYTYNWNSGQSTPSISVAPAITTTYTVTTTDSKGCSKTDQVIVNVSTKPTVNAGADKSICQNSSVTINTTVSSGTAPYTYLWSNGSTTQNITVNPIANTTYTVTITDVIGCSNTDAVIVTVNSNPTVNAGLDQSSCGASSFTFSTSVNSGTSPYTYIWSNGASTANITVSPPMTTNYLVTVTDVNGCTGTDMVTGNINPVPTINLGNDKSICIGNSTTINAAATGGTSPFTYLWSTNATTQSITISPVNNTTYTVTVTDNKSCTATDQIVISINALPIANAGNDQSICSASSANLSGTGSGGLSPYSYTWSTGQNVANITVSPTNTTTYTLSLTDANLCQGTDQVVINVNPSINVNAGIDQSICGVGTATLSSNVSGGTAPYTYLWTNNATSPSITVNPMVTTSYTVTVTDSKGCSQTDQVVVFVGNSFTVNAGADQIICGGTTVNIATNITGGVAPFSYLWSNGNTNSSITVTPLITTNYTVTVTDANNCIGTDIVIINVNAKPQINAGADQTICGTGFVTLSGISSGGLSPYTYLWSTGQSTSNITVSPSTTTSYSITVTDANGCSNTDLVIVNVSSKPLINAGLDQTLCGNTTTTISTMVSGGTSPYTYLWSNNATTSSITVNPSITTSYTVTVSDSKLCTNTDAVIININSKPIVDAGPDQTLCGTTTTTLTANVSSGSSPYTYKWSNNATTNAITITPSTTTSYTITVTDAKGCTNTDQVIVVVGTKPTVNAGIDQTICEGKSASLSASGSGGVSPYSYLWSTATTGSNIVVFPIKDSTFNVTITDTKGCTNTDAILVKVNKKPITNAGVDRNVCGSTTVTLTVTATSGTSPYTYKWSNLSTKTSTMVKPNISTTYTATVTDSKSCSSTDQVVVFVNPKPTVNAGSDVSICPSTSTTLNAVGYGGTAPYSYNWNNGLGGGSSKTVSPSTKTSYTVTITDSKICSATDQVVVSIKTCLVFNERSNSSKFSLVPNPSSGEVRMIFDKELPLKYTIKLISTHGSVIELATNEIDQISKNELVLHLNRVVQGSYILEFIGQTEVLKSQLIIVESN